MKFVYTDGDKIGYYENGRKNVFDSSYITRYKENTLRSARNKEWKKKSEQMLDDFYFESDNSVHAEICGVSLTTEENKIAYTFTVNETSGIYYKYIDDEKKTEAHVISSNEVDFVSYYVNENGDALGAIRTGENSADIAVFNREGGDYKLLTGGGSLDENPSLDKDGNILYNSYGIGRDADNQFVSYFPSEILKLNVQTMQLETLISDENFSFVKPLEDKDGNLYCIRKPGAERKRENIFLQIVMIPVRIVEAIVGFVSAFVSIFSGKPMVSDGGKSTGNGSAAKNGKQNKAKLFVNNQLINVEEELKRNEKSEYGGFIPQDWVLIKVKPNGNGEYEALEEIAKGVADYCIVEENGETVILYTNGKYVLQSVWETEKRVNKKIVNADCCLKIAALQKAQKSSVTPFEESDLFSQF